MAAPVAVTCVLVLPGFTHRIANQDRDIAVEVMLAAPAAGFRRAASPALRLPGAVGLVAGPDDRRIRVDVAEIAWFDLKLATGQSLLERCATGFSLLWYWLLSPASWPAVRTGRVTAVGLALAALGLVLWFLSLLAVGLDGLVQGLGAVFGAESLPAWLPGAAKAVAPIGGLLLILLAWASGSPTFEALPGFTRDWLRNAAAQGVGLRQRTRMRVQARIDEAREAGYGRIVVIAHSIGAAFLIDALANAEHAEDLEVVTLGAPVGFLAARHPPLGDALERLLGRRAPPAWLDLHAPSDYLAGPVPGHRERYGDGASRAMRFPEAGLADRWLQRTHLMYWRDDEAVGAVAAFVLGIKPMMSFERRGTA